MIKITKCHICHTDNIVQITKYGDKFEGEAVHMCLNCGLAFLSPRMSDDELRAYYSSGSFSRDFRGSEEVAETKEELLDERAKIRWDVIKNKLSDEQTFFEIGCSSGHFLRYAAQKIPGIFGVDPSEGYVKYIDQHEEWIHENQGEIRVGEFPGESFEDIVDEFDAIGVFHILEHVPNPRKFLKAIHSRLTNDGLFFLEYPDLEIASHRNTLSPTYFQKSHLYDFSGFNLVNLLSETGFLIVDVSVPNMNHPSDKNVLVVCKKTNKQIKDRLFEPKRAQRLYDRLKSKLLITRPIRLNLGRRPIILHIASHNINVGDGAISHGIRKAVSYVLNEDADILGMDIVDYIGGISVERINSYNPDFIIIGGGGTIDGHKSRTKSGTAFDLSIDDIKKINAPMTFVGLGHNSFRDQEFHNANILNDFILFLESEKIPFSVRRDKSKQRLSQAISDKASAYIDEIPDPGFFIGYGMQEKIDKNIHISPLAKNLIVFQVAGDALVHRAGKNYLNFLSSFADVIESVAMQDGIYALLATHTYDDIFTQAHISQLIPHHILRVKISSTGIYHPIYAESFFRTYAMADMVVGMRGHSVICATGLSVPTIAINTHDKVKGYMEEIGAEDWLVSPTNDFDEQLIDAINRLKSNSNTQLKKVKENTSNWKNEFLQFMSKSLEQI